MDIQQIHQNVFNLLMGYHKQDKSFLFTLRQLNRKSRLDKGYWFFGDDYYMAVSFWSGNDRITKMPNIAFAINVDGHTTLELNAKDVTKYQFFNYELLENLGIEAKPFQVHYRKYYREFKNPKYLESLKSFIEKDKVVIDNAVRNKTSFYPEGLEFTNGIDFINVATFQKQLAIVKRYQSKRNESERKTGYLKEFIIKKFGPILNVNVKDIPRGCKWIFITGENGSGKTSILRALAVGLTSNNDHNEEVAKDYKDFEIVIGLDNANAIQRTTIKETDDYKEGVLLPKGLAVYGPVRLLTQGSLDKHFEKSDENHISRQTTYGLFNPIGILRDISGSFVLSVRPKYYQPALDNFLDNILRNLELILPNIYKVEVRRAQDGHEILYFQGNEKSGLEKNSTTFNKLPSGTRNFAALILDMLLRFSEKQDEVTDLADFVGIVLIDEIDLHLHPKLQKEIVIQLSDTFPNIQFIVTTHSPIPMLGAPVNSVFINVYKDEKDEICATKLDIKIGNLLPNALLTSPLFGFDELINEHHQTGQRLNTEDDYNEAIFYNILEKKIRERSLVKKDE